MKKTNHLEIFLSNPQNCEELRHEKKPAINVINSEKRFYDFALGKINENNEFVQETNYFGKIPLPFFRKDLFYIAKKELKYFEEIAEKWSIFVNNKLIKKGKIKLLFVNIFSTTNSNNNNLIVRNNNINNHTIVPNS